MKLGSVKLLARLTAAAALGAAAFAPPALPQKGLKIDVALVLAVDTSQSMTLPELILQRDGYVEAFRARDVASAIKSGPEGRIAVTYMEWGADFQQNVLIPWTILDGRAAALSFAAELEDAPVHGLTRTSISAALVEAASLSDQLPLPAYRHVIDVSGDGPNNDGPPVETIRDQVIGRGFTINGLPILIRRMNQAYDIDHLDWYYRQCVIGGPGAFEAPVSDLEHLAQAVRRKLVQEIAGEPSRIVPAQLKIPQKMDCMIGEKRRAQGAQGG